MEDQEFDDEYTLDEQPEDSDNPVEYNDTEEEEFDSSDSSPLASNNKGALTLLLESVGFDLLKTDTVKTVCAIAAILGIVGFLTIDKRVFVVTLVAMVVYVLDEAVATFSISSITNKLPKFKNNTVPNEEPDEGTVEQDNETEE